MHISFPLLFRAQPLKKPYPSASAPLIPNWYVHFTHTVFCLFQIISNTLYPLRSIQVYVPPFTLPSPGPNLRIISNNCPDMIGTCPPFPHTLRTPINRSTPANIVCAFCRSFRWYCLSLGSAPFPRYSIRKRLPCSSLVLLYVFSYSLAANYSPIIPLPYRLFPFRL